jgi:hypothetical protein
VCPFLLPTVRLSPRTGLKSADPFHLSTVAIVPKKGGQNQPSPRGDRKMMLEVTVEEEVRGEGCPGDIGGRAASGELSGDVAASGELGGGVAASGKLDDRDSGLDCEQCFL